MFFVNLIFWLWAFIVPTAVAGFLAFLLYNNSSDYLLFSIIISLIGIVLGVVLAEYVRRKQGLDYFFGKLLSTPELEEENANKNEGRSTTEENKNNDVK